MPRLALLLLLAAGPLAGCRTGPATPQELEAALQGDARTVVRGELVTLYSPYDEAASGAYARVLEHEAGLVRALLDSPAAPPVRLYLVPVADAGDSIRVADRHGVAGGAFVEGFAFAYVHAEARGPFQRAELQRDTLRHELAHVYLRRTGLVRDKWFDEGAASWIEALEARGEDLHEPVFAPALVGARAGAGPGTLAALLAWSRAERLPAEEAAARYERAQALVAFLVAHAPGETWRARLAAVHALSDEELLALEPEWLAWLGALDAVAVLRARSASDDPEVRAEAAGALPVLAEHGAPELATRAADELALALLADPLTLPAAATFLLYYRAAALTRADLEALERAPDPGRALVAGALRARRDEPVDLARARAAWSRLSAHERERCAVLAFQLPGLEE